MRRDLMNILRCPKCKKELELTVEKENDEIEEGTLYCESCKIEYPIQEGIPNMIIEE